LLRLDVQQARIGGTAMTPDEKAIRAVIERWMQATAAGDLDTVLGLMTDDIVFMVPGKEPFGKEAFAQSSKAMSGVTFEGQSSPVEIKVLGDWAYVRNHITVKTVSKAGGETKTRSGYTLSIFTRRPDGSWLLARDANLLS
jgi:uncharacterized protein (TIGR02246 family)